MAADGERCERPITPSAGPRPRPWSPSGRPIGRRMASAPDASRRRDGAGALHIVRIAPSGNPRDARDERPDVITDPGSARIREQRHRRRCGSRACRRSSGGAADGPGGTGRRGVAGGPRRARCADPWPAGRARRRCSKRPALTDLRWAGLTRGAPLAHFFDLPAVRESGAEFVSSRSAAAAPQAALFAGWLDASLNWRGRVRGPARAVERALRVGHSQGQHLRTRAVPAPRQQPACPRKDASAASSMASRVLSLGARPCRRSWPRSSASAPRDLAFERALERALDPRS